MLARERRQATNGIYDIHTNVMHYPRNTQPTHARWERVPEEEEEEPAQRQRATSDHHHSSSNPILLTNGSKNAKSSFSGDDDDDDDDDGDAAAHIIIDRQQQPPSSKKKNSTTTTIFPAVPRSITRNFLVTDIEYVSPAMPDMPYPGPDSQLMDEFDTSLSGVPQEIIDLLDEQQRRDFLQARGFERDWKSRWKTEREDKLRGRLDISYNS